MKKDITIKGNRWTVDTTNYGVDIFLNGGYVTTMEDDVCRGHAYWLKRGAIWVADNAHNYKELPKSV
jgi:hypothetical protein